MISPDPERKPSRFPYGLVLFGLVAVVAFAVGFLLFDVTQSRVLVKRFGYYVIAGTFAWAVLAVWRIAPAFARSAATLRRAEVGQLAAVILGCTAIAALTAPFGYKILFDEMVLQATASNLHFFREISTTLRAYHVDGVLLPMDTYLDKRPYFYAFLVSLLHDVFGYREANAFALNFVLFPIILVQVYALARRIAGHAGALLAVLSIGTVSTLVHCATSAGMDTLNTAMLLAVMQLAMHYLDDPDELRLSALILGTLLLAQSRYESIVFVGPVALIALEGWRRARRIILPAAAILAPALLIPYALQSMYVSGTPILWELRDNAQTRFSLTHLKPNLWHAYQYFFNTTHGRTNSLWLSGAGFASLGWGAVVLWRARRGWRTAPAAAPVLVVFAGALLGNLALLMCYYWGQLDDPMVARIAVPFLALLAVVVAFAVDQASRFRASVPWLCAGVAVVAYLWNGVIANQQQFRLNTIATEIAWERAFVATLPPGERLIITNKSALPWFMEGTPAIGLEHARHRGEALRLQLERKTFRDVLVCQSYIPTDENGNYALDPAHRLPDEFILEPIVEHRVGAKLARISRLVSVTTPAAGPSAPASGEKPSRPER